MWTEATGRPALLGVTSGLPPVPPLVPEGGPGPWTTVGTQPFLQSFAMAKITTQSRPLARHTTRQGEHMFPQT